MDIEIAKEPKVRQIYLYRIGEDGVRRKFRFTLDEQMTITREEECHENGLPIAVTDHSGTATEAAQAAMLAAPQIRVLKERGIDFHLEGGQIIVDKIPPLELQITQFFLPEGECPWLGCQELKDRYLEELRALAGEDGDCSNCDTSKIQAKYREVVKNHIIEYNQSHANPIPQKRSGDPEIPRSQEGPKE